MAYLSRTPCVPLFSTSFNRVETEGLLDYQGRAGIISTVRWNLRPVIFGVEEIGKMRIESKKLKDSQQASFETVSN